METEVQIESVRYEPLEWDSDGLKPGMLTVTTAARVLSPDEMAGIKWWLEEWFLEWKGFADMKNDTDFLKRSQTGKLKLSFSAEK